MHVKIHTAAIPDGTTTISNAAAELVRMGFNPSKIERVDRIKALAAALVSEIEDIEDGSAAMERPDILRETEAALTHVQIAAMLAVAAATRGR